MRYRQTGTVRATLRRESPGCARGAAAARETCDARVSIGKRSTTFGFVVLALAALGIWLGTGAAGAHAARDAGVTVIHANFYLSDPVPRADLKQWTAARGRRVISLDSGGAVLRGWMYPGPNERAPTVVVFGGNGYSIASIDGLLRQLARQGATIVEYDHRGFGFSGGRADVLRMRADALRIYDATVRQMGGRPVIVFGYSLGSIFASYVASLRDVRGLVLAAPLATSAAEMRYLLKPGTYRIAADSADAQNVVGSVARSHAPLLVAHGTADRLIPISEGRAVFAASRAPEKVFVPVPGAGHDALFVNPRVLAAFRKFLRSFDGASAK